MATIADLQVTIGANVAPLNAGLQQAVAQIQQFQGKAAAAGTQLNQAAFNAAGGVKQLGGAFIGANGQLYNFKAGANGVAIAAQKMGAGFNAVIPAVNAVGPGLNNVANRCQQVAYNFKSTSMAANQLPPALNKTGAAAIGAGNGLLACGRNANQVVAGLNRVGATSQSTSAQLGGLAGSFMRFARYMVVSTAIWETIRIPKSLITNAMDFEKQMANVATTIDDLGRRGPAIEALSKGIMSLSRELPITPEKLGAASYEIYSSGITDTNQALSILRASTKLSIAGLGEMTDTTKMVVAAINAYGISADDAARVSNVMFEQVRLGVLTVDDLTSQFGQCAALARITGVSFEETSAMVAAMTLGGISATQAQQYLGQSFMQITGTSGKFKSALEKAGISMKKFQSMIETEGMVESLNKVQAAMKLTDQEFNQLFTRKQSRAVMSMLTANEEVEAKYRELMESMKNNNLDDAMGPELETGAMKIEAVKAAWERLSIEFGKSGGLDTAKVSLIGLADFLEGITYGGGQARSAMADVNSDLGTFLRLMEKIGAIGPPPIFQFFKAMRDLGNGPDVTSLTGSKQIESDQLKSIKTYQKQIEDESRLQIQHLNNQRNAGEITDYEYSKQIEDYNGYITDTKILAVNEMAVKMTADRDNLQLLINGGITTTAQLRKNKDLSKQVGKETIEFWEKDYGGDLKKVLSSINEMLPQLVSDAAKEMEKATGQFANIKAPDLPFASILKAEDIKKGRVELHESITTISQELDRLAELGRDKFGKKLGEGVAGPSIEDLTGIPSKAAFDAKIKEYESSLDQLQLLQSVGGVKNLDAARTQIEAQIAPLEEGLKNYAGVWEKGGAELERVTGVDSTAKAKARLAELKSMLAELKQLESQADVQGKAPATSQASTAMAQDVVTQTQSTMNQAAGIISASAGPWSSAMMAATQAAIDPVKQMSVELVGRSIVPDMVNAIGEEFGRLTDLMVTPLASAAASVTTIFSSWKDLVSGGEGLGMDQMAASMTAGWTVVAAASEAGVSAMTASTTAKMGEMSSGVQGQFQSMASTSTSIIARMMGSMTAVMAAGYARMLASTRSWASQMIAIYESVDNRVVRNSIIPDMMDRIYYVMSGGYKKELDLTGMTVDQLIANFERLEKGMGGFTRQGIDDLRLYLKEVRDIGAPSGPGLAGLNATSPLFAVDPEMEKLASEGKHMPFAPVPSKTGKGPSATATQHYEARTHDRDIADAQKTVDAYRHVNEEWLKIQTNGLVGLEATFAKENLDYMKRLNDFQANTAILLAAAQEDENRKAQIRENAAIFEKGLYDELQRNKKLAAENEVQDRLLEEDANYQHWEKILADTTAFHDLVRDSYEQLGQGMSSAMGQYFAAMMLGMKSRNKDILAATYELIGSLAGAFGTYYVTKGVAMVAEHDPAGWAVIAGGVALKTLGSLFGGMGKKVSGSGSSASGGGGGGGYSTTPTPDVGAQKEGKFGGKVQYVVDVGRLADKAGIIKDLGEFTRELVSEFNQLQGMGVDIQVR